MTETDNRPLAGRPPHVAPSIVVDFNLFGDKRYAEAGGVHAGLLKLAEDHGRGVRWTPHNGGHFYLNDYDLIFEAARNTDVFSSCKMAFPPAEDDAEYRTIPVNL